VFYLTVFLKRSEFGLFFAVVEIVAILGYFSDVGLAASLIQRNQKLKLIEIRTSFTIQQLLVTTLCLATLFGIPWLATAYQLSTDGVWLVRALVAGFFLASLKTIPSILLERVLKFDKLVIVEVIETLLFYGIAVYMAWQGFGVKSYTYAVVIRGITGVVLIYALAPWKIGFAFSLPAVKELFKFGIPFQLNTFIAAVKDRLLNLVLWKFIGADGMGIIGWAQTWSQKPLRVVTDNVTKVTFPAFSRLQDDPKELASAIEKMLFFSATVIFPILVGTGVLIKPVVELIPNYQKWQPALFAFYLYLFNSGWAAITTPLTNTLAAIGKIKWVTGLMVMWTILTWAVIAPLGYRFGYNGVAIGVALVALSSVVAIGLVYRQVKFNLIRSLAAPMFASAFMGTGTWLLSRYLPTNLPNVIVVGISGGLMYASVIYLLAKDQIVGQIKSVASKLKQP
jgi:O-antigen/teichoic acid export membrane protein